MCWNSCGSQALIVPRLLHRQLPKADRQLTNAQKNYCVKWHLAAARNEVKNDLSEPPRVLRRLFSLSGLSNDKGKQVFTRGT